MAEQGVRALTEIPPEYKYADAGMALPSRDEQTHIALGRAVEGIKTQGYRLKQEFEKLYEAKERLGGTVEPDFEPHVRAAWNEWLRQRGEPADENQELEVPDFVQR